MRSISVTPRNVASSLRPKLPVLHRTSLTQSLLSVRPPSPPPKLLPASLQSSCCDFLEWSSACLHLCEDHIHRWRPTLLYSSSRKQFLIPEQRHFLSVHSIPGFIVTLFVYCSLAWVKQNILITALTTNEFSNCVGICLHVVFSPSVFTSNVTEGHLKRRDVYSISQSERQSKHAIGFTVSLLKIT